MTAEEYVKKHFEKSEISTLPGTAFGLGPKKPDFLTLRGPRMSDVLSAIFSLFLFRNAISSPEAFNSIREVFEGQSHIMDVRTDTKKR